MNICHIDGKIQGAPLAGYSFDSPWEVLTQRSRPSTASLLAPEQIFPEASIVAAISLNCKTDKELTAAKIAKILCHSHANLCTVLARLYRKKKIDRKWLKLQLADGGTRHSFVYFKIGEPHGN